MSGSIPLLPILLFTLRHDLGVSHLRILTRMAALTVVEQAHVLQIYTCPYRVGGYVPDVHPGSLMNHVAIAQMRATSPSTYHPLLPSGTPPLLPIRLLPQPHSQRRADIPEADTAPRKKPGPTMAHRFDCSLVDTIETRALEARIIVLETEVRRHKWQRQAADDFAVQHIMCTQALEAGTRVDTLEDTVTKEFAAAMAGKKNRSKRKKKQVELGIAITTMALRESSDSLDGLRKWSLCLALAIAQHLVKSNLRLALYKMMLLHGWRRPVRPLPLKQLMPCEGQH
ncbi:hypothetical protein Tco_0247121 [Tanacetum coccineum]